MTTQLPAAQLAEQINKQLPGSVTGTVSNSIIVKPESLLAVAALLKNNPEYDLKYLNYVTGADYYDYFEISYLATSIEKNQSAAFKARAYGRENPTVPSVVEIWRGADYQEREIFDLFGVNFTGHPNLKRIVLWDGFNGYPLRKDYL